MKRSSKKGSSRKSSSRASSSSSKGLLETAPSLVVLSPDVIDTPFMRRRFNPNEKLDLPKPAHFLDLRRPKKNIKNEDENDDIQPEEDTKIDNGILTDQEKMEYAKNNQGTKKSKNEFASVGAVSGLDLSSLGGPNLTDGIHLDNDFFKGNSQNANLKNTIFNQINQNGTNDNSDNLNIKINSKKENKIQGSGNDIKKKQTKFNVNGQILSDDSNNDDDIYLLDEDSDNDKNQEKNNQNAEINQFNNMNSQKRKRKVVNQNGEYDYQYYSNDDENEDKNRLNVQNELVKYNKKRKKRKIIDQDGNNTYEYYDYSEDIDEDNKNKIDNKIELINDNNKKKRRFKNKNGEYEYEYLDDEDDKDNKDNLLDDKNNRKKRRIKNEKGEYEYEYYDDNEKLNANDSKSDVDKKRNKRRVKNENGEYEYEYFDDNENKNNNKRRIKNKNGEYEYEYFDDNENKNKNKRRVKNENGEYEYEYFDDNENKNKNKRRVKNENGEYEYEYFDDNENKANLLDHTSNRKKRRIKKENGEYEYEYFDENKDNLDENQNNLLINDKRNKRRFKNENGEYEYEYFDENEDENKGTLNNNINENKRRVKNEKGEYEYEYFDEKEDNLDENNKRNKRRFRNEKGEYEYEYFDDKDKLDENNKRNKRRVRNENGEYEYEYFDENENNLDENNERNKRRVKNENGEYEYEYFDENINNSNNNLSSNTNNQKKRKFKLEDGNYEYEYYTGDTDSENHIITDNEIDKIIADISDSDKPYNKLNRKNRVKNTNGEYEYDNDDSQNSDTMNQNTNKNNKETTNKGQKHRGTIYNSDEFDSDDSFEFESSTNKNQSKAEENKKSKLNHQPRRNVNMLNLKNKKQSTTKHNKNNKYDPEFNNFPERRPAVPGKDFDEYSVSSLRMEFNSDEDDDINFTSDKDLMDPDNLHVSFNDPESFSPKFGPNSGINDDNASATTNAFSVFNDGPEFVEKVHRQLNFDATGPMFEEEFNNLDTQGRRVIGRLGRLQAVQKRNWLSKIWKLYDRNNNYSDEAFWRTLEVIMNDGNDENINNNNRNGFGFGKGLNNNDGFNDSGSGFGPANGFNNNYGFNDNRSGYGPGSNRLNNNGFNDNNSGYGAGNGLNNNDGKTGSGINRNNEYMDNFNGINQMSNLNFDDSMSNATSKTSKSTISNSSWRSRRSQKGNSLANSIMLNGMIQSVKDVLHQFIVYTPSLDSGLPPSLNFKAAILGPRYSGKTTFLRSLFLETLVFLANTSNFKSTFIVPFDARDMSSNKSKQDKIRPNDAFESRESFYKFVSSLIIEALLIQRPDLQLFTSSLTKAFNEPLNPSPTKLKKLPKPISSQDYLRRPMQSVDRLLNKIHNLYLDTINDKNASIKKQNNTDSVFKNFLREVIELPLTIAGIFGFDSTLLLFDHLDLLNITIDDINLADLQLDTLEKCQYIISVEDADRFNKLLLSKKKVVRGRTKSISNETKSNQLTSSKTPRSMSFGTKSTNMKKLSNLASNSDINKAETTKASKQSSESLSIKNFASSMVRVPVLDTCHSSFAESVLDIEFEEIIEDENENDKSDKDNKFNMKNKNKSSSSLRAAKNFKSFNNNNNAKKAPIPSLPFKKNISISSDTCGGCPTFVSRFDDICKGLLDLKNTTKPSLRLEKAVILTEKVEILLDLLISFGTDQQDGPPPIKTVSIRNKEDE